MCGTEGADSPKKARIPRRRRGFPEGADSNPRLLRGIRNKKSGDRSPLFQLRKSDAYIHGVPMLYDAPNLRNVELRFTG